MHLVPQVKALQAKLEAQAAKLEAQVAELAAAKTAATAAVMDAQARGRADARQAAKLKDAQVTGGMKIPNPVPGLGPSILACRALGAFVLAVGMQCPFPQHAA